MPERRADARGRRARTIVSVVRDGCRRFIARALRAGPIPRHVAVIMDGNRRFACASGVALARGHARGADVLREACA